MRGLWDDDHAAPAEFFGEGVWRGQQRRTLIDYNHGVPVVKDLQPPQRTEREPVPPVLQLHTMDTLSALAQLMRKVELCELLRHTMRTYHGRRVPAVVAAHPPVRRAGTEQPGVDLHGTAMTSRL